MQKTVVYVNSTKSAYILNLGAKGEFTLYPESGGPNLPREGVSHVAVTCESAPVLERARRGHLEERALSSLVGLQEHRVLVVATKGVFRMGPVPADTNIPRMLTAERIAEQFPDVGTEETRKAPAEPAKNPVKTDETTAFKTGNAGKAQPITAKV